MRRMKPQKQLLQFVMLALLSVVSVLVTSNESYAALDCTQCHGSAGSNRPVDTPYAAPASYRNVTTGAFKGSHVKHLGATPAAADCTVCHNNSAYGSAHRDGNIQMSSGIGYGKVSPFPQTSNPTLSTCSTASCHATYTDVAPLTTPDWGTAATCSSCHATTPTTNAHPKHTGLTSVTCATCHTNPGAAGHVNGAVTVDSTLGYAASTPKHASTPAAFTSTCTASCHNTGRSPIASPVWSGSAAACTACHALQPATGSHTKHLTNAGSATFTCGKCHDGAAQGTDAGTAHLDGNIDTISALGYPQDKAKGSALATCSTVYCHSTVQGAGGNTAPTYKDVTWGGTATCGSCHSVTNPGTGTHTKHLLSSVQSIGCESCHVAYGSATHADGMITLTTALQTGYSQDGTPGNGYGTCSTASCHDAGRGLQTATWGSSPAACTACHALVPATGSHAKHVTGTAYAKVSCGQCHTGTTQGGPAGAGHLDGNIDTAVALGYEQNKGKNTAFATCATTYCHSSAQGAGNDPTATPTYKAVTWGATLTGCSSCHGNTASIASGSHRAHLDYVPGTITCSNCHTSSSAATHVDGSINIGGDKVTTAQYSGTATPGDAYGSCSTSTCHSGGPLAFPPKAATWGTQLDCAGCHSFPPATAYHDGITGNCNSCHSDVSAGNVTTSTITDQTLHMNGVVDGGQCDSCHGYPPVKDMTNLGVAGNYTGAKLATNLTAGGVHAVEGHLLKTLRPSDGFSKCLTCHPQGVTHNTGFSNVSTTKVQVVVDTQYKFNAGQAIVYSAFERASTAPTGTCSNVSCHFKVTPQW